MSEIADNVMRVRERIAAALERSGRGGDGLTLVAVTKTFGADVVDAVIEAGIEDIGENRVQEFLAKRERVTRPCRWHLIGHLQRNKATKVVGAVDMIQSVDSVRLAETLNRIAGERGERVRSLLEVNTSGEASKEGVSPDEAVAVAEAITGLDHLALEGLMTIGPVSIDPDATRRCFRELYALRERARAATGLALPHLSMGMSADFEIGVEEGATIVRVGRIITGERAS
jgi:pyridoxal phosphate enzyme (YggS family)